VLALYSLSCFVNYTLMVAAAALTASRQTRQIFIGSAAGCVVALVMSPLLIKTFHANGAILSMIVTSLVVGALYVSAFVRKVRPSLQASDVVLPPATSAVGAAAVEAPAAVIPSAQEEHS
jgi:O-antigen/teichoic acid export membrane protein